MAIIAILVGITIGVAGPIQKNAARKRAKVEIDAIELALENFKIDNGDYPNATQVGVPGSVYSGDPTGSGYTVASQQLFAALCGRSDYTLAPTTTVYFEARQGQVDNSTGGVSALVDPFGFPYGYFYDFSSSSGPGGQSKSLFNLVVPDIWSTANERDTPADTSNFIYYRWVTNWDNSAP